MQSLTQRYRLGLSLAVRDGLDVLYLQRTHGDFIHFNDPIGARRPLDYAPTGWACLVGYGEEERQMVLAALKRQAPHRWPITETAIAGAATDYREHGFVFSIGVMHEQLNAVAVPIRSVRNGRVYGLSASGLAAEWPREKLLPVGAELASLAKALATATD